MFDVSWASFFSFKPLFLKNSWIRVEGALFLKAHESVVYSVEFVAVGETHLQVRQRGEGSV